MSRKPTERERELVELWSVLQDMSPDGAEMFVHRLESLRSMLEIVSYDVAEYRVFDKGLKAKKAAMVARAIIHRLKMELDGAALQIQEKQAKSPLNAPAPPPAAPGAAKPPPSPPAAPDAPEPAPAAPKRAGNNAAPTSRAIVRATVIDAEFTERKPRSKTGRAHLRMATLEADGQLGLLPGFDSVLGLPAKGETGR